MDFTTVFKESSRHWDTPYFIWIKGCPICLIYFSNFFGIFLCLLFYLFVNPEYSLVSLFGIHLLGLVPAVIQPFYKTKVFTLVSQIVLGFCGTSFLISGTFFLDTIIYKPAEILFMTFIFLGMRKIMSFYGKVYSTELPGHVFFRNNSLFLFHLRNLSSRDEYK